MVMLLLIPLMLSLGVTLVHASTSVDEYQNLMPPYCGGPGGHGVDWRSVLGEEVGWNNHTCYGIRDLYRSYRAKSERERRYLLQTANSHFDYSVGHLSERFPLMPEILYFRGLTYKLLGEHSKAAADWTRSLNLNPHYVKSISELVDLYARHLKNPQRALELVVEGLRDNPESKQLQQRYVQLGGKLPYPEPRKKSQVQGAVIETDGTQQKAGDGLLHRPLLEKKQAGQTGLEKPDAPREPITGGSDNSWCRFCPIPERN